MKSQRQRAILALIAQSPVTTQAQLTSLLRASGVPCTQTTVSRDIRELRLVKGKNGYAPPGANEKTSPDARGANFAGILAETVVRVRASGNMVVLRTLEGMAMAACAVIDRMSEATAPARRASSAAPDEPPRSKELSGAAFAAAPPEDASHADLPTSADTLADVSTIARGDLPSESASPTPAPVASSPGAASLPADLPILGSIAGDDTIFLVAESPRAAAAVEEAISRLLRKPAG